MEFFNLIRLIFIIFFHWERFTFSSFVFLCVKIHLSTILFKLFNINFNVKILSIPIYFPWNVLNKYKVNFLCISLTNSGMLHAYIYTGFYLTTSSFTIHSKFRTLFVCWLFTVPKKKQGMGSSVVLVEYSSSM